MASQHRLSLNEVLLVRIAPLANDSFDGPHRSDEVPRSMSGTGRPRGMPNSHPMGCCAGPNGREEPGMTDAAWGTKGHFQTPGHFTPD